MLDESTTESVLYRSDLSHTYADREGLRRQLDHLESLGVLTPITDAPTIVVTSCRLDKENPVHGEPTLQKWVIETEVIGSVRPEQIRYKLVPYGE